MVQFHLSVVFVSGVLVTKVLSDENSSIDSLIKQVVLRVGRPTLMLTVNKQTVMNKKIILSQKFPKKGINCEFKKNYRKRWGYCSK